MTDGHRRSLMKTVSYRVSSSILTGAVVFLFTNELILSLGVGALDILVKSIWYYSHERLWNRTKWGKS
tara:strand:- start:2363 stop:2566 length:204 start_codon:yes stop_codon:yes gene_type:complete